MGTRITHNVSRPPAVQITVDGAVVEATPGEMLATALLAVSCTVFWRDASGRARGPFCNMGVCFDCLVEVHAGGGQPRRVRACLTPVVAGMVVTTGAAEGSR